MEPRWIWLHPVLCAPRLHPRRTPNTRRGRAPILWVTVTTAVGCHNGEHAALLDHWLNRFSARPCKHKQTRRHLPPVLRGTRTPYTRLLSSLSQLPTRWVIHCAHLRRTLTTISVANTCKAGDPFKDFSYPSLNKVEYGTRLVNATLTRLREKSSRINRASKRGDSFFFS